MKNWKFTWKKAIICLIVAVFTAGNMGNAALPSVQAGEIAGAEEEITAKNTVDAAARPGKTADGTESVPEEATEERPFTFGGLPDNDELLEAYMDHLAGRDADGEFTALGSEGEKRLTDASERKLYREIRSAVTEIADGSRTSSIIEVEGLSLSRAGWEASVDKIINYLLMDCPYELYWYDKKNAPVSVRIYGNTVYSVIFSMTVAQEYQGSDVYTTDPAKTGAAKSAVSNAKAIVSRYAARSDREKLSSYCREICSLVSYNTGAVSGDMAYGNPWQLIWVFDGNPNTNVVCEGYSKAFQYLCDLSRFSGNTACYTVTGMMGDGITSEGHMWNIVSFNGGNYLVDVTNSDTGHFGSDGSLFLASPDGGSAGTSYTFLNTRKRTMVFSYSAETRALLDQGILTLTPKNTEPDKTQPDKTEPGKTEPDKTQPSKSPVKVSRIKITAKTKTMNLKTKKTQTLKAAVFPADASNKKVTWKSSNKKIASVNAKGKVTAKKAGTVKITAAAKDGSGKKATVKIKIKKK